MNGVLLIDKPKNITSRDVVDAVAKKLGTKKVGHTGTLDPIATGVLVVCVGKATKLVDRLTSKDKKYLASCCLGIKTDTLDIEGKILEEQDVKIEKEKIIDALNSFKGKYLQEVPIYSAVKVNGKKLYEYARENIDVILPKREVEIKEIKLVDEVEYKDNKTYFRFECSVSKGTYIRALINDIAQKLDTVGIMTDLRRISQGAYSTSSCVKLDEVDESRLIPIKDILDVSKVELSSDIEKKVLNGAPIENKYNTNSILFVKNDKAVALYEGDKILKIKIMFKEV